MLKILNQKVVNAKGEAIKLTPQEQFHAEYLQEECRRRHYNAAAYEVSMTTLSAISKLITEQKLFQMNPADYVPIRVGQNPWVSNILTYRTYNLGDAFETGVINLGANNSKLASADVAVDTLSIQVINWGKTLSYNIFDLRLAAQSGNWDLVIQKERSRLQNWQLGIQHVAFLGLAGDSNALGLFTQSGITTNLTRIPGPLSKMSGPDLKDFSAGVLDDYRANCSRSAWPNRFVIPESDYLGLAGPSNADYHIKSTLQVLQETFSIMTGKDFKILPCAYGDHGFSNQSYQQYALYNYDDSSIRMDIPVDYTNTLANSIDNFGYQNVGYGQFTGVLAYRPTELLYFRFTP